MFNLYDVIKIKKGCWQLQHPENSNSRIGNFKTKKDAENYRLNVMLKIINAG
jgi:hypothetical protein